MGKLLKWIAIGLGVVAIVLLAGQPKSFVDPMTHHDGGIKATWGPITCAVWTWSDPIVIETPGLPVNCSRT